MTPDSTPTPAAATDIRLDVYVPTEPWERPANEIELDLEELSALEASLGLFAPLSKKRAAMLPKYPGQYRLFRVTRGETLCVVGERGYSAFYVLSADDLNRLIAHPGFNDATKAQARNLVQPATADAASEAPTDLATLPVVRAWLFSGTAGQTARRWPWARGSVEQLPESLSYDGPGQIDTKKQYDDLKPGDIFGEMACRARGPRSASIVAERDWFVFEFQRPIYDLLVAEKGGYELRELLDRLYRERVLGSHLGKIAFLKDCTTQTIGRLRDVAELVEFSHGEVICDENDEADFVYLVRSGLVQVVVHACRVLNERDFAADSSAGGTTPAALAAEFKRLAIGAHGATEPSELAEGKGGAPVKAVRPSAAPAFDPAPIAKSAWLLLEEPERQAVTEIAGGQIAGGRVRAMFCALNRILRDESRKFIAVWFNDAAFRKSVGPTAAGRALNKTLREAGTDLKTMPELTIARLNRLAWQCLFSPYLPPFEPLEWVERTLVYRTRGEVIGEIAAMESDTRTATCVGYFHDGGIAKQLDLARSKVELVRIPAESFREIVAQDPAARRKITEIIAERKASDRVQERGRPANVGNIDAERFRELGLAQAQKLMVIDLDRCTRCGECVTACVHTHDDGRTRLFLDGARIGRFLVPFTCRNCRDPQCMIGCPVGSIHPGDDGEIRIRSWCIGCGICEKQCPYNAIQMDELTRPESQTRNDALKSMEQHGYAGFAKNVQDRRAVVCDLCTSQADQQPVCVKHCPHDAAFRFDALFEAFPS